MSSRKRNSLVSVEEKVLPFGEKPQYQYKPTKPKRTLRKKDTIVCVDEADESVQEDIEEELAATLKENETSGQQGGNDEKRAVPPKESGTVGTGAADLSKQQEQDTILTGHDEEGVEPKLPEHGERGTVSCKHEKHTNHDLETIVEMPLSNEESLREYRRPSSWSGTDMENPLSSTSNDRISHVSMGEAETMLSKGLYTPEGVDYFNTVQLLKRKEAVKEMLSKVQEIQKNEYDQYRSDQEKKAQEQLEKEREKEDRLRKLALRGHLPGANDSKGWQLVKQLEQARDAERNISIKMLKNAFVSPKTLSRQGSKSSNDTVSRRDSGVSSQSSSKIKRQQPGSSEGSSVSRELKEMSNPESNTGQSETAL